MNNKDFVDYTTAKRLKECGFDEPCDHYYVKDDAPDGQRLLVPCGDYKDWNHLKDDCPLVHIECSAPTLWQAQKWLRAKGFDIIVYRSFSGGYSYHTEVHSSDIFGPAQTGNPERSYEAVLAAGIADMLKLIDNQAN